MASSLTPDIPDADKDASMVPRSSSTVVGASTRDAIDGRKRVVGANSGIVVVPAEISICFYLDIHPCLLLFMKGHFRPPEHPQKIFMSPVNSLVPGTPVNS